ncbi:MAG: T9SS C-terminal target domain-containing protein [Balneolaceae bacterium]|nr:MAG: T9SS C-terminal target domain-containing protein [Balneolaceae bacterium]
MYRFSRLRATAHATVPAAAYRAWLMAAMVTTVVMASLTSVATAGPKDTTDTGPIKCLTPWIMLYGEDAHQTIPGHIDSDSADWDLVQPDRDLAQPDRDLAHSDRDLAHADRIPPHIRRKIEEIHRHEIRDAEVYLSPSGRFRLLFQRDGFHAVPADDASGTGIPDYIERAAEYADYSWQRQVDEIGFVDPVGATPLTIEFRNIGTRTYGYTVRDGETTRIVVHNTFLNFPPNDDPEGNQLGALKVTIAHELKHSIQFATNRWQGDAGTIHWVEMDATMMENIVYPQVNDYYNYIGGTSGIFGNPGRSTPVAYSHVTWSLFFAEHMGMSYWVDAWEQVRRDPQIPMIRAMRRAVGSNPEMETARFRELIVRNHLWHATSGARTVDGYGFAESAAYPDAAIALIPPPVPEPYMDTGQLPTLSAAYRMLYPGMGQIGQIFVTATHDHDNLGIGVLAYRRDGTAMEWIPASASDGSATDGSGVTRGYSPFSVADVDSFLLVVANADRNSPVSYQLDVLIESIPDVVVLEQNYPNPFSEAAGNPGTTITFSMPEREYVRLSVYDVTGRKVALLMDGEEDPGRYSVPFDAKGLASGVYIYRLQAGSVRKTGKMTFLR